MVIDPKGKGEHYAVWKAQKEGKPTLSQMLRDEIDLVIRDSFTFPDFLNLLEKKGYTVSRNPNRKYLTVRPPGAKRNFRLDRLGEGYTVEDIKRRIQEQQIPLLVAVNKADLLPPEAAGNWPHAQTLCDTGIQPGQILVVSAATGAGIHALKERIAAAAKGQENGRRIVADLIAPDDLVLLVVPIDKAAPKGRLIMPQQQTIRDILDCGAQALVVRETGLAQALAALARPPRLVITDSQVFGRVAAELPADMPLTSFSILFARYKGDLETVVRGVTALDRLQDGDRVLISEGCTHHRQCGDIGTVKLPAWIAEYTGKRLEFSFTSGTEFPDDLTPYRLVVHCGGCMLGEREMKYRLRCAADQQVPMTNYGILIAYVHGILPRSVEVFPQIRRLLR